MEGALGFLVKPSAQIDFVVILNLLPFSYTRVLRQPPRVLRHTPCRKLEAAIVRMFYQDINILIKMKPITMYCN